MVNLEAVVEATYAFVTQKQRLSLSETSNTDQHMPPRNSVQTQLEEYAAGGDIERVVDICERFELEVPRKRE